MTTRTCSLAALSALLSSVASAATITYTGTPTKSATDLTDAANWGDGATPISSSDDYVISGSSSAQYGFGGGGVFGGRSLTVTSGKLLPSATGQTFTFANEGVIFDGGSFYFGNSGIDTWYNAKIYGNITVNKNVSVTPLRKDDNRIDFFGPKFTCASTATLAFYSASGNATQDDRIHARLVGDFSDFEGTLKSGSGGSHYCSVFLGTDNFNGTMVVGGTLANGIDGRLGVCSTNESGAIVENKGLAVVKNLTIGQNGHLRVACTYDGTTDAVTGATIRVTGAVTWPSAGKVSLHVASYPSLGSYNLTQRRFPLVVMPKAAGLSLDRFTVSGMPSKTASSAAYLTHRLAKGDYDADNDAIFYEVDKYMQAVGGSDSSGDSFLDANESYFKAAWPQATSTDFDPEMWYFEFSGARNAPYDRKFGGRRLVIGWSDTTSPRMRTYSTTKNAFDLVLWYGALEMKPNSSIFGTIDVSTVLAAKSVSLYFGDVSSGSSSSVEIHSVIFGGNDLAIKGLSGSVPCTASLYGTNDCFTGRLKLSNAGTTVSITNACALGGPVGDGSAVVYNGLSLCNGSALRVRQSTTMSQTSRGLYAPGQTTLTVDAEKTFAWGSQITFAGTLAKKGAGTLVFGGPARFTSAELETPLAGTNVLSVAAGRIGVTVTNALDGCAITLADGAGLLVDATGGDEDLARYGAVLTKTLSSVTAEGSTVSVEFLLTDAARASKADMSLAVATLSDEATAEALRAKLRFAAKKYGNLRGINFTLRANDDGSSTILANLTGPKGFVVVFK